MWLGGQQCPRPRRAIALDPAHPRLEGARTMTDDRSPRRPDQSDPTDFDWDSPRWREDAAGSDADERRRRFRDEPAPKQRGAIDAERSISGAHPTDEAPDQP